ncbi:MAG: NAD(P)/FAD-dependent oxidoreductase [Clostridioides sp.]|jgi:thioredoxin reductase (NADPH)|nr:NAD(P)/FAD-dependent oxidoreductase [Clostridioides sp.]
MRYDIAIIGSGAAGLSAAVNAKIRNKNFILFGNDELSSKLVKAPSVDNYLGFYDISGEELKDRFKKHIESMDISIDNKKINSVYSMGDYFALMSGQEMFEATTVIVATGVEFSKPISGEEEFLGKGVGYCATCDGMLYKDKSVAVIGYNKEALSDANYLSELTSKTYFVPMFPEVGMMRSSLDLNSDIEIIKDKPTKITGENLVDHLHFKNHDELAVDGVFVIKDSTTPAALVPGLDTKDRHVMVDAMMRTNIPGCFAAGDCVGKPYSYIKSAGQGQIAALSAVEYLDSMKR